MSWRIDYDPKVFEEAKIHPTIVKKVVAKIPQEFNAGGARKVKTGVFECDGATLFIVYQYFDGGVFIKSAKPHKRR